MIFYGRLLARPGEWRMGVGLVIGQVFLVRFAGPISIGFGRGVPGRSRACGDPLLVFPLSP
jgi:hypothetical protein